MNESDLLLIEQRTPLSVRELAPNERPRERLRRCGARALSSVELLALVLGTGGSRRSALALAHELLGACGGSLRRLATAPVAAITAIPGLGDARAAVVHAALELGRRLVEESRAEGALIRVPRDIYLAYAPRLEDLPVEEFHVAVLDAQQRFERDITVTRGILNGSLVHPREVFREAIAERAASVILVHNHPSGDPSPSLDDRMVTNQLVLAGRVLDIPVQDHVVIGRGRYVSFVEAGLMPAPGTPNPLPSPAARGVENSTASPATDIVAGSGLRLT
ncbi:MAG: RadC family protein [Gemmatimonadaceae bacterium]